MNRQLSLLCLVLLAAFCAIPSTLFGQAFYGSVVGTIMDPSGAALRGASVTLTNAATGERRQTQSSGEGDYQFLNLVPGTYRVEVEQQGFKKSTQSVEVTVS